MKKFKQIILLTISVATIMFTASCGNVKKEYTIQSSSTSVKGDLSDYFEVVNETYKLETAKENGTTDNFIINVKFKRNDRPHEWEKANIYLYCDLLEANGAPVINGAIANGDGNPDQLKNLKSGEKGWVKFSYSSLDNPKEFEKVKSFSINSKVEIPDAISSSSPSSSSDKATTEEKGDCEKFIKEYEAFVNSYVKLLKKYKANPTDPTILNEYTEAAQKATEMQSNAGDCTDAKYVSKLLELNNKIAQALQ